VVECSPDLSPIKILWLVNADINIQSLRVNGDFTYNYIHEVGSADSVNFNTGTVQNKYYKIAAGITWRNYMGMLAAGDSVKVLKAGDYKVHCWISATTSNANDKIKIKLFTNNTQNATSLGIFKINSQGTGNNDSRYYMWYKTFAVNDWISIRAQNQTGARSINVTDIKLFIEKVPE